MNNITLDLLTEFYKCKVKIEKSSEQLYEKALEVCRWEEENLGKTYKFKDYFLNSEKSDCVEIYNMRGILEINENYELKKEDYVCFEIRDNIGFGDIDERTLRIPLYKLLSDTWREDALKEYTSKLEQEKVETEKEQKELERKKEEQERAEYERLKAKFESDN